MGATATLASMLNSLSAINTPSATGCEALAAFCKASADELRLNILRVLRHNAFSVQELCHIFDLKQSAMSHHLKVLAAAQWVTTRREGNSIFYRRFELGHGEPFASLQQALLQCIDHCELDETIARRVQEVEQHRTELSQAFFVENAGRFREQQELMADFELYANGVANMLDAIPLPAHQLAVEIGPGEGLFLPELAHRFVQVSAFDTSAEILQQALELTEKENLANVHLYQGDTRAAAQMTNVDCVVINMVLHHVANPADLFRDTAMCLKPGGALLVTDLCHHDQEWARTACGDVWLGFEPDDLERWAAQAGLIHGHSSFLAQRNGFKVQIQHFLKPNPSVNPLSQP